MQGFQVFIVFLLPGSHGFTDNKKAQECSYFFKFEIKKSKVPIATVRITKPFLGTKFFTRFSTRQFGGEFLSSCGEGPSIHGKLPSVQLAFRGQR